MDNKPLPWNYQVVFQMPPQVYHMTYTLPKVATVPDVEGKLAAMNKYSDALAVINRIKDL